MKPEMKKLIIANLPYLLFVYLFGKLGQAYRLAEGIDLSQKLLHFADGCAAAFESAAPSFHPIDLLIGVAGAAALRLMVYCKGKNAKKYRKGVEYGSTVRANGAGMRTHEGRNRRSQKRKIPRLPSSILQGIPSEKSCKVPRI